MAAIELRLPPDAEGMRPTGTDVRGTSALVVEGVAEIIEGADGASSPQETTTAKWFHRVPTPGVRYYFFEQ